ncbi:hypothetical protein ET495_10110 [Xylanimonas allomyrinae]|uniref:Uncharacterized protein n=1 Tax=Xylanimonas allomyrinae TaxID=2509459 RepID=A0A4P6ELM5_9MICO|nr:hypothetical protein [Xylanimonas allomyrinae]QAY63542.1 hypothetical protein ET495_10110 [Xylanimonas allomyrinae]
MDSLVGTAFDLVRGDATLAAVTALNTGWAPYQCLTTTAKGVGGIGNLILLIGSAAVEAATPAIERAAVEAATPAITRAAVEAATPRLRAQGAIAALAVAGAVVTGIVVMRRRRERGEPEAVLGLPDGA